MKKRITSIALIIALLATCFAGTYAYLTDKDEAVNVMTLGKVKIEQHEYERAKNTDGTFKTDTIDGRTSYVLTDYVNDKALHPAIVPNGGTAAGITWDYDATPVRMSQVDSHGGASVFNTPNAVDKFVTVENTGKTDAYIRTIIAFEIGSAEMVSPDFPAYERLIHTEMRAETADKNTNGEQPWTKGFNDVVEIGGNNFLVYELFYTGAMTSSGWKHENGILPAGETTYPSLCQVYMASRATNEDCEALDGNNNGTFEIMVLSQAVQATGFTGPQVALNTAFGAADELKVKEWFGETVTPIVVTTAAELQSAVDAAVDGDVILFANDIAGDVTVSQKAGVKFTIDGQDKTMDGDIIVDGKSARYEDAGLTIKNINFASADMNEPAYVNLGKSGNNGTRYTNNVTVKDCTFSFTGTGDKAAVKSYTGGDWNLTVDGCTVNAGMHSMLQVTNVEKGLTITGCKVYSKNGANLNSTPALAMTGCEFDVQGYAVRFGVKNTTNNGNFSISNSTLKSAVAEADDAVIICRGEMSGATVTLTNTTLVGTPEITGNAVIVK